MPVSMAMLAVRMGLAIFLVTFSEIFSAVDGSVQVRVGDPIFVTIWN
jgi:hypothetical protein